MATDVSKGSLNSTVSNQWAMRPDDERFLDLSSLHSQVSTWKAESDAYDVTPGELRVITDDGNVKVAFGDAEGLDLTHYAFDQVASIAKAPGRYLRRLPAPLLAANLRYGLLANKGDEISAYVRNSGLTGDDVSLRGLTSRKYGRIFDADVVEAVQKIAGNGTGDTKWKVPGVMSWSTMVHNPHVDITKENTTLYASDRDVFMFLVDDTHPVVVGKLDNGDDDLMFPGFYVWNSEVGSKTFGVSTMWMRAVCANRNIWGMEHYQEISFRHTAGAPERFLKEAAPAIEAFSTAPASAVQAKVNAAKAATICKVTDKEDDDRIDFLARFGFTKAQASKLIKRGEEEEGHRPSNVWDMVQAVTAEARSITYTDERITMEQVGSKMMAKVKA